MRTVEQVLGWFLLRERLYDAKLLTSELIEQENKIQINAQLLNKEFNFEVVNYLWDKIDVVYETLIAVEMLMQGYLLLTIDGGWLVINPRGEDYQIENTQCTCGDFLYNRKQKSRCKHLVFRDWHQTYRKRILLAKQEYLKINSNPEALLHTADPEHH